MEPWWPQKAHEWIALIAGSVGAITGIGGLVMGLLNYRRDRPRMRVSFGLNQTVIGYHDYDPAKEYIVVRIVNQGRREVQINRVDALLYKGGGYLIPNCGGSVLSEANPETVVLVERTKLDLREVSCFSVRTGADQEYRCYVHKLPNRLLRFWQHRDSRRKMRREVREERNRLLSR